MTKSEKIVSRARALITKKTTAQLVECFLLTGPIDSPDIPTVRGWIMDELEARNPVAFDEWLEESAEDETLPAYFL